jgi:hypothetical protein
MAKKQTRRSISVSRTTYEKLKSFCETNGISMSQFVETRVGDFLGEAGPENADSHPVAPRPSAPRPVQSSAPSQGRPQLTSVPAQRPVASSGSAGAPATSAAVAQHPQRPQATPMTSAAARYAVEPPPPIIKRAEQPAPKAPAMPKANEIFTF